MNEHATRNRTATFSPEETRREIEKLGPWFHNLHLPNGAQTAPDHWFGDFPAVKWREIAPFIPADLSGARVLDIGCNAGFYSFELARRGADVLGIDMDERYLRQARWARQETGLKSVRFEKASVYDVASLGFRPDIVFFMGVFYHLRYPLLALDLIAGLKPGQLVFQTLTRGDEEVSPLARQDANFRTRSRLQARDWPAMAFIETTFSGDPTNWWVPNHAGVLAMLRSAGFALEAQPAHEIYLCRRDAAVAAPFLDEAHRDAGRVAQRIQPGE